jgi:hypothetical protein
VTIIEKVASRPTTTIPRSQPTNKSTSTWPWLI